VGVLGGLGPFDENRGGKEKVCIFEDAMKRQGGKSRNSVKFRKKKRAGRLGKRKKRFAGSRGGNISSKRE